MLNIQILDTEFNDVNVKIDILISKKCIVVLNESFEDILNASEFCGEVLFIPFAACLVFVPAKVLAPFAVTMTSDKCSGIAVNLTSKVERSC